MENFWEWMYIKDYACPKCKSIVCDKIYKGFRKDKQTKQMLIGYMIEYLRSKDFDILKGIAEKIWISISIEDFYETLENKIKEKNGN